MRPYIGTAIFALLVLLVAVAAGLHTINELRNSEAILFVENTVDARAATLEEVEEVEAEELLPTPSPFQEAFAAAAKQHGLDPRLLQAIAEVESNYDPKIVSSAGAQGLMQLMPSTAKKMGAKDPFDPKESIEAGAQLVRLLLDEYDNNVPLALAAYNAGTTAVNKYGGVPPFAETQQYVAKVLDLWEENKAARNHFTLVASIRGDVDGRTRPADRGGE